VFVDLFFFPIVFFAFILISHVLCIGPFSLSVDGRGGEENWVVCGSRMSGRAKSQKVEPGGKKRNKSSKLSRLCTCSSSSNL